MINTVGAANIYVAAFACLLAAGCTSQKVLQATGGSRADGTVNLSFETGLFENAVIDWEQAGSVARKRCAAWGYTDAEAFGGSTTQCQAYNAYGSCIHAFVTVPYQCINAVGASQAAAPAAGPSLSPPAGVSPSAMPPDIAPPAAEPASTPQAAATAYVSQPSAAIVDSQLPNASTPPLPSARGAKPPPIITFEHASDSTSANQSSDFDDLINSVANGAKPATGSN